MAMNHRRYIAWYHSSARVVIVKWRAAGCRPYIENVSFLLKICVTILILYSKNAKNVVYYRRGGNLPPATFRFLSRANQTGSR